MTHDDMEKIMDDAFKAAFQFKLKDIWNDTRKNPLVEVAAYKSEDQLLDIIHAVMMNWVKEEVLANDDFVSVEERFAECQESICEAVRDLKIDRRYQESLLE
jgi:hypothetical protein